MIAVVDYGAGNVQSVLNALDDLKVQYIVSNKEPEIYHADKIIFPGVGEASFAMRKLHLNSLVTMLRVTKKPLLGICLGMQLLSEKSNEGNTCCLGVVPGTCVKYDETKVKVPHMGWNEVKIDLNSVLFDGIEDGSHFYFANSYYLPVCDYTIASSVYDVTFAAAVQRNNYYGVQFHPEKSGEAGIKLLTNFIEKC
ncbi:MAG: imidazole glycerol phosphate synthase, glutamine amidotransferase subunit [Stygiobacter sp. RIFOXYC12_FULL_38_8]|nr:MAG: imidazole glycerol phosphate synthase, glutamine amidotransferase subunit [Stygiobacter sp. GWC2_38_9]OGU83593.1 MAG: imidazole glycerol phosphate synthase, glutamine amidotransferase subunit [Stygiobacter sp. RIFOXYA12_FULL_38_9]OGV09429.1 MAG: imidazole glycerol phosphate synthase, glutamine amidotransferase subunit [Stygiobacter sp. RIFOXYB2_FULL_37_11]OGV11317.1 MAG: imidazole glycerol phosphate synthase, glutamine amidotransferase subunit [Stygiobacter sp. RIFOXYA2_FULL_38_8]OGV153